MSEWGGDLDRLLALGVAAIATLKTERGIRLTKDLNPADFPRLFAFEPRFVTDELPHQRETVASTYTLLLVTQGESQEATCLKAEALRDAIRGDPTLAGRVLSSRVTESTLREHPAVAEKGVGFLVTVRREA